MQTLLIRSFAAVAMGLSAMAVALQFAAAQDFELEIGRDGPRLRLNDGNCNPRYEDCRRDGERWRGEERRLSRRSFCTEERALDKAERMGLRRARVVDSDRRTIEVRGRTRGGERVLLTFGRAPNCPLYN